MLTRIQREILNRMNPPGQSAGLGDAIYHMAAVMAPHDKWFVDPVNGYDTLDYGYGTSWDKPFKTITYALSKAAAWDWIFLKGGDYDEGAAVNITLEGVKLIGPGIDNQNVAMIYSSSASHHLLTVNAHNVEICGIGFTQTKDTYDAIRVSTSASYYKCHIHDCRFDGYGAGEHAVKTDGDDGTYDSPDVVVERCVMRSWQTACIYGNATRGQYRNNTILTTAAKIGIEHVPTGGNRPDTAIFGNMIMGANSTDTGIKITNSPNQGALLIELNSVSNCATPITVSKYTSWYENNHWGVNDAKYHREMRKWYVDASMAAAGDGMSWMSAFKTITAAVAAAASRDIIEVMPGDYDETATIAITTNGLTIRGVQSEFNQNRAMVYDGAGAGYDLMTINAHEVTIDGLAFSAAADTYDGIVVGGASASYKVAIRNCRFDGWSGEYGIQAGAGNDCPDILIENNLFRSWNTAACQLNCTRAVFRKNTVHVVTDKIGLEHVPAGGDRPDNEYVDNNFSGVANATTTGIKFTGAPNDGTILCMRNYFAGTYDVTITKIAAFAGVMNYEGDNGGGTLVDTVT